MKPYDPSTPKASLAALSLMMAAVTMAAMVFAPAGLEAVRADNAVLRRVASSWPIHRAIAVGARQAVGAGRSSPSPTTHHASGGNS